jgi:hypothetical protein
MNMLVVVVVVVLCCRRLFIIWGYMLLLFFLYVSSHHPLYLINPHRNDFNALDEEDLDALLDDLDLDDEDL